MRLVLSSIASAVATPVKSLLVTSGLDVNPMDVSSGRFLCNGMHMPHKPCSSGMSFSFFAHVKVVEANVN